MTSTPEEIRHLMQESRRIHPVHYRRSVDAEVTCGAEVKRGESLTTSASVQMVDCDECLMLLAGGAEAGA